MKEKFVARSDIPRAGWLFVDVLIEDTANFVCQNCKFPHVRYVHELKHKTTETRIFVGCVCAEHLTQDFTNPRLREKTLRGRAGRRLRWPTLNWKWSSNGNLYLKKQGMVIVLKRSGRKWGFAYKAADTDDFWTSIPAIYDRADDAKLAAFDSIYPVKTMD